jgi:hypothetical protein
MRMTIRMLAGLMAVSGALAFSGSGWAQTVEERGTLRQKTEKQIAKVEEKSAAFQPMNQIAELHGKIAAHQVELAKKLLALGNERGAKAMADQAERTLSLGPGQPIPAVIQ